MPFSSLTRIVNKVYQQQGKYFPVRGGIAFSASPTFNNNYHYNAFAQRKMSSGTDSSKAETLVVEHDSKNKKFFIKLGEAEAKLEYNEEKHQNGDVILDMWHTEVPPQLQGRGIAKILANEAFEYAVKNKLKMHLSCSYLQKYLKDNPLDKYKSIAV